MLCSVVTNRVAAMPRELLGHPRESKEFREGEVVMVVQVMRSGNREFTGTRLRIKVRKEQRFLCKVTWTRRQA